MPRRAARLPLTNVIRGFVMMVGAAVIVAAVFVWIAGQVGGIVAGAIAAVLILAARPWRSRPG